MKKRSPSGKNSDSALKKWLTCGPSLCQSPTRSDGSLKCRSRRMGTMTAGMAAAVSTADMVSSMTVTVINVTIRSEEHTSELQSLMRISYAVFCLKKKNKQKITINT